MYWYKETNTDQFKEYYAKRNSIVAKMKRAFVIYTFFTILAIGGFLLFSGINYFDVPNLCFLKIKYDNKNGDAGTIKQAIEKIKVEDFTKYRELCTYVDKIFEKPCTLASPKNGNLFVANSDGCYIYGSKIIMIEPEVAEDGLVSRRANLIKNYTEKSKTFWVSQ